jgi:imidazolonepropionase-like amidohydrolase
MGIKLVAGTDSSPARMPADFTASSEVAEFVKIGIPPIEAIQSATSRAADCLGLGTRTGSIRPGYEADLFVVNGNPIADISALKSVVLVINDGQIALNRLPK